MAHDGFAFLHRKKIHHDFDQCLSKRGPVAGRIFFDAFVKILAKRFVLFDRRCVENAVAAFANPHGASFAKPAFLKLPVESIDVLKDRAVPWMRFLSLAESCALVPGR